MAKINLLPWREEERKERQRQFFRITAGAACLMLAVAGYVWLHLETKISSQQERVAYLAGVGQEYDKKIAQIRDIEQEEEQLKLRIDVIEKLQSSRPEIVKVFEELARSLPDGLYLTNLVNQGSSIQLQGFAESNATVSNFMRKLDESDWFTKPNLGAIKSVMRDKRRMSQFTLQVKRADQTKKKAVEKKPRTGGSKA